jgi:polyhydroxybutyrate depolymerase
MKAAEQGWTAARVVRRLPAALPAIAAAVVLAACAAGTPDSRADASHTSTGASFSSLLPSDCSTGAAQGTRPGPIVCGAASAGGAATTHRESLVIALHGSPGTSQSTQGPLDMQGLSHFAELANASGFVVAFLGSSDQQHPWRPPSDINYVSSMIDQLTATYNLDPSRVYVTGFSAGGYETWRLGCELANKVAAIAIVSGAMNGQLYHSCSPSRPVSQLLMVGDADGTRWTGIPGRLPSAQQTTTRWLGIDGCASSPVQDVQPIPAVDQKTWTSCIDGSAVALYVIHGAQHVWPPFGVGAPNLYSASVAVWNFFRAHKAAPTTPGARGFSFQADQRGRTRTVVVTFRSTESVIVTETLAAKNRRLTRASFVINQAGRSQVTLTIPPKTKAGTYTVTTTVVDSFGRKLWVTHNVRVPKPAKR